MTQPVRCLTADPPWKFGDSLPGPKRGASSHYRTMPLKEICAYELPPLADDCWLFLWRVASMQAEALQVVAAWGFKVKAEIAWIKLAQSGNPKMGMGHYVRNCHESALVCTRGRVKAASRAELSVLMTAPGRHSQKPEAFYQKVERLVGGGPYCELFGRKQRPGWTVLGDQARP